MGTPVLWTTAKSDPPCNLKIWFDQFLMAVTVKEIVKPGILLEDAKPFIKEHEPRPETARTGENAAAVPVREANDRLARDKVILVNEERKERGLKVGHNKNTNDV